MRLESLGHLFLDCQGLSWCCMRFEALFHLIVLEDFHVRPIHLMPAPFPASGEEKSPETAGMGPQMSSVGLTNHSKHAKTDCCITSPFGAPG